MGAKIGDRVLAIRDGQDGKLFVFGFGVRQEDEIPPYQMFRDANISNPCILLDNGQKVYGCECWWGSEQQMIEKYAGWDFIEVPLPERSE